MFEGRRDLLSWLRVVVVSACLLCFLTCREGYAAQSPVAAAQTGTVTGTVLDPTGAVIPRAVVTLSSRGHDNVVVSSDAVGNFSVEGLAPGTYTINARAQGFRFANPRRITVSAGETQRITLTLAIEIQQEQVTVNGNQIDSSPESNGGAIVLKGSDLDALPTNPDDLQTELEAVAGADPDTGTQFFVDGFTGGRLPPKSAIREIRINQNPYSAQYDQIGFGRVEIFTKPGTDKWHGNLFVEGNDSSFNSRNPFVAVQPPYHSFDLFGGIDGPVTRHSSQFTELWRESAADQSIVNAFVLDSSLNQQPFKQVFPNSSSNTDYSTRFDTQIGKIQTLTVRYHLSQTVRTNGGVGQFALSSQAYNSRNTEQVLQFSDSQAYGARLLNETRFQYVRDRDRQIPLNNGPTIVVQGGFTGGGSNLGVNNDNQDHYELQDYVQTTRGPHTIDFGARLRETRDANYSTANFNGQYTFATLTAYQIMEQGMQKGWTAAQILAAGGGPSLFSQTIGTPSIAVTVFDAGLYAEDNYKLKPNLTLSYGLRFESQTQMPDHADVAPRLGVSWAISRGKKKPPVAVIRSGFGLFYQRFPSINVLEAARQNGVREQDLVINDPLFFPAVCTGSASACTSATTLAPAVFRISPVLRSPYILMAGTGLDKPLGKIGHLSVNYQYARGVHLFLSRNINAPLPGTYNAADPTSGVRPLGTSQNIYEYESEGESVRNRLVVNANVRTKQMALYGYYMLSKASADTSGIGRFPSNGYDLQQDFGRSSNDIRNRAWIGGHWTIWRGFAANPFLIYQSGAPFNIVVGQDLNGDTQFNDRPAFATDLSRASVVRTRWGDFDTAPLPGQKVIPVNDAQGPGTFVMNMRVMKDFNFGPVLPQETPAPAKAGAAKSAAGDKKKPVERKYTLSLGVSSNNVLNHVNLAPPVGVLGSPLFGKSTALSGAFGNGSANRTVNVNLFFRF